MARTSQVRHERRIRDITGHEIASKVELHEIIEPVRAVVAPEDVHRVTLNNRDVTEAAAWSCPQSLHRCPLASVEFELVEVVHC